MKRIFTLLSLVAIGITYAQVGANTTAPKATLDVTAKTDNTTADVEGILIPRVSKQKAFLMAGNTTTPVEESTLIYVNDLSDFTDPADGTEATVVDITENGFYHWSGAKWVRGSSKDGDEWVYEPKIKRVVLKRRPGGMGFVSYNDRGEFIQKSNLKGKIRVFNYMTQNYDEYPVSEYTGYAYNERMGFASDLKKNNPLLFIEY